MVNSGARVPPEVPLPSAIDHDANFITHRIIRALTVKSPDTIRSMLV